MAHTPPSTFDLSPLRGLPRRDVNPDAARAEAAIREECAAIGLMLPWYSGYTSMTGHLFPATPIDRLIPIGLLNNILFYLDDLYSSHRSSLDEVMSGDAIEAISAGVEALKRGTVSATALPDSEAICNGFARVNDLFSQSAPPLLLGRVATAVEQCFQAMTRPARDYFVNELPDPDRYMSIRYHDSGMKIEVELADFAHGFILPDEVIQHPAIDRARDITVHIGGLMNDLFSYQKEVIRNAQMFNLVPVMQAARCCTPHDAFEAAIQHVNGLTDEFNEIASNMPTFADKRLDAQTATYFESLADQIAATYHWQLHTDRYKSKGSVVPLLEANSHDPAR